MYHPDVDAPCVRRPSFCKPTALEAPGDNFPHIPGMCVPDIEFGGDHFSLSMIAIFLRRPFPCINIRTLTLTSLSFEPHRPFCRQPRMHCCCSFLETQDISLRFGCESPTSSSSCGPGGAMFCFFSTQSRDLTLLRWRTGHKLGSKKSQTVPAQAWGCR